MPLAHLESKRIALNIELDVLAHAELSQTLKFLAEVGPEPEARLTGVLTGKLFADASLVLFDTTTYFGGFGPAGLASFGYSRDQRSVTVRR